MQRLGTPLITFAVAVAALALRRPLGVVLGCAVATLAAGWYAAITLELESDTTKLIPQNVTFLRNYNAYKQSLPDQRRLNVVVIDGGNADSVAWAVLALHDRLKTRTDLFRRVDAPQFSDFAKQYGLLRLDVPSLIRVSDTLLAAQPALSALSRSPTLDGVAALAALTAPTAERPSGSSFLRFFTPLEQAVRAHGEDLPMPVSWRATLFGEAAAPTRGILIVQGLLDDDSAKGAEAEGSRVIRAAAAELGITAENGLTLRMTGRGALSHEELQSALYSVQVAGTLSLAFLAVVLWWGFRSLRAIAACLITLLCGLVLTAAAAAASVGTLNILSVAFAVLFLGLGIDFAIHVMLRLSETDGQGDAASQATTVVGRTGRAVLLAAATTAIGFLSFLPTDYRGLAELGAISAIGLAVAALMAFTLLPALASLMGRPVSGDIALPLPGTERLSLAVTKAARTILFLAAALAVGSAVLASRTTFDFNTLGLKGSNSESVQTFLDLQADGWVTSYSLSVLTPDRDAAIAAVRDLEALPEVGAAETPYDAIPGDQEEKLLILEDAAFVLWPSLNPPDRKSDLTPAAREEALARLLKALDEGSRHADPELAERMRVLQQDLAAIGADPADLARFETALTRHLPATLDTLTEALSAAPLTYEDLPVPVRRLNETEDGRLRVAVSPAGALTDHAALRRFVEAVQTQYPDATGTPALEVGIANIIVNAFFQALGIALAGIALVLILVLRSVRDSLLVMTPLLLAGLITAGAGVVFDIPFNFANIIVLPLILGLGVDNGVHMIMRWREERSLASVLASTTPRAIVLSGLTTAVSFGTLSIAENQGLSSMGQLLLIGIAAILVATVLILPALLATLSPGGADALAPRPKDGP